jgi:hypothetical protein
MEIKERHYRRIPQLVRRERGDGRSHALNTDAANKLNALYLMESLPGVGPRRPPLIPTADGAIERILLTIPTSWHWPGAWEPRIGYLLS